MSKTPCISIYGMSAVHNIPNSNIQDLCPAFGDEQNAELSALFPKIPLRRIPRYARMGLLAGVKALQAIPFNQETGLVVGTAYAGIQMSFDFMNSILDAEPRLSSPTAFSHAVNNMGAGLLSLYLNLQGPCHTVTQFSLSFAGALQTASTLIHSNRAEFVLVGCMDEVDQRFTKICSAENLQLAEGAIFFIVGKEDENLPKISTSWTVKTSSDLVTEQSPLMRETPLYHALTTMMAIENSQNQDISCTSQHTQVCATIHIES